MDPVTRATVISGVNGAAASDRLAGKSKTPIISCIG
jgi:hypothetical protein